MNSSETRRHKTIEKHKDSFRNFSKKIREGFAGAKEHEVIPDDSEVFQMLDSLTPSASYGMVSGLSPLPSFLKGFTTALVAGNCQEYLTSVLAGEGLSGVYIAQAPLESLDKDAHKRIHQNHQSGFLQDIDRKVREVSELVMEKLLTGNFSQVVIEAYKQSIASKIQTSATLSTLGTPDFTRLHKTPIKWGEFLGQAERLSLAQVAEVFLLESKKKKERGESTNEAQTISESLSVFNLTSDQKSSIEGFNEEASEFTPLQTKQLFLVLLKKIGLHDWKVKDNTADSFSVNAKGSEVKVPTTKNLQANELRYIVAHEFIHIIKGANGINQPCKQLRSGLLGYQESEEGIAMLAELIMGEPFGSDRQNKQAARYLAVDLALQTTTDENGKKIPKYTIQEIYNLLVGPFSVKPEDAYNIVWRIFRGTSLERKMVDVDVELADGERQVRSIPEVYTKDSVYFMGMIEMLNWIKTSLPGHEKLSSYIDMSKDFSPNSLAAIGKIINVHEVNKSLDQKKLASGYESLQKMGRDTLLSLIDILLVGKLSMEDLLNPEWQKILKPGKISYKQLFA